MNNLLVRVGSLVVLACAILFLSAKPANGQADGAALYKANCAVCHGADGKGDSAMGKTLKVRDLSSEDVQKETDAQLTDITTNGKNKMPAYKAKLKAEQIKALVGFMRSLKK